MMKKRFMCLATLLSLLLLVSCGGKKETAAGVTAAAPEKRDTASADTDDPRLETLLDAMRADGIEVKPSPVIDMLDDPEYGSPDYRQMDPDHAGAYTVKYTDTDGDGENELVAFYLTDYVFSGDTPDWGKNGGVCYRLNIAGYDTDGNGGTVSDAVSTDLTTERIILSMHIGDTLCATEENGKIVLMTKGGLDGLTRVRMTVYSFLDGKLAETDAFLFDNSFSGTEGKYYVKLEEGADRAKTWCDGTSGSEEVKRAVAGLRSRFAELGLPEKLFPLAEDGLCFYIVRLDDSFEDAWDLVIKADSEYDEQNGDSGNFLLVRDGTGTFAEYGA